MSATGRGAVRRPANYYPTPAWCVRRLLERWHPPGGRWLEPGAGEGHIIRAVNAIRQDVTWTAVELREECRSRLCPDARVVIGDFLGVRVADDASPPFDVAIGNPPFPLAIPFIERSLELAPVVAFLLSTGLLGSQERVAWWPKHLPDMYVIPDRISFRGTGSGDSVYCAWFVWYRDRRASMASYCVLPHTPRHEQLEDLGQLSLLDLPQRALDLEDA